MYLARDIKPPNNQSCFLQFFPRFFSQFLAVEKESKNFIGPKHVYLGFGSMKSLFSF
jgi:hypothetical protein